MNLAWRNIWRNKRRTVLTVIAISFATAIVVFFQGLQISAHETAIMATTRIFQGAIQVQREDYYDNPQISRSIENPETLRKGIATVEGVEAATLRAIGFALISSEDRTYGVQVVGVDPELEPRLSSIPGLIREGNYFDKESYYHVALGAAIARNLRVGVGDELTILGQGKDGSLAAAVVFVQGIYESGSLEVDRSLIQIPLQAFQEIFYMPDEAHSVVVQVSSLSRLNQIQERISGTIEGQHLRVLRWDEITPGLKQSLEFDRITDWIFLLSLIVIVIIGILNSFLMSIIERTREFGMLLCLGMKPGGLTRLILLECSQLVILGTMLGSFLGALIILYFNQVGFIIPGAEDILQLWNLPEALYPEVTLRALTTGPLIILVSAIVLLLPFSLRPFWLNPLEAMR